MYVYVIIIRFIRLVTIVSYTRHYTDRKKHVSIDNDY